MPDLHWDEVRPFFDAGLMGSLPDLTITGTTAGDWQALIDLIQERGWQWEYEPDDTWQESLPTAGELLASLAADYIARLYVRPVPDILAIFRLYAADTIDFDVSLHELQGQEKLDIFCGFLTAIGRTLGKAVNMHAEGDSPHAVLGYDPAAGRVVLLADPREGLVVDPATGGFCPPRAE